MKSELSELAELVVKKREREGLSLRALAEVTGVSFSTLSRLQRGRGVPDENTKLRLIRWLGEEADDLAKDFQEVIEVHFRAAKNVEAKTVRALARVAECVRQQFNEAP